MDLKKKFAIGFVIYNTGESSLDRIKMISDENFDVFIFDNSPSDSRLRLLASINDNIRYFTCGKNVGLGFGLSVVCSNAYFDGYKYLLFFDQDTIFTNSTLEFVSNLIDAKLSLQNNYAVVCLSSKDLKSSVSDFEIFNRQLVISSGSIFDLCIAQKLNWHNVKYFVDNVDYEFCLRAVNSGYKLGECTAVPDFDHVSGQEDKEYLFFRKKYLLRQYPRSRLIDSLASYFRLFYYSITSKTFKYFFILFRSFSISIYGQLLAYTFKINPLIKKNHEL